MPGRRDLARHLDVLRARRPGHRQHRPRCRPRDTGRDPVDDNVSSKTLPPTAGTGDRHASLAAVLAVALGRRLLLPGGTQDGRVTLGRCMVFTPTRSCAPAFRTAPGSEAAAQVPRADVLSPEPIRVDSPQSGGVIAWISWRRWFASTGEA
jgi:hypothetical protein